MSNRPRALLVEGGAAERARPDRKIVCNSRTLYSLIIRRCSGLPSPTDSAESVPGSLFGWARCETTDEWIIAQQRFCCPE